MHPLEPAWQNITREFEIARDQAARRARSQATDDLNQIARRLKSYRTEIEWASALLDGVVRFAPQAALFAVGESVLSLRDSRNLDLPADAIIALPAAAAFQSVLDAQDTVVALRTSGEVSDLLMAPAASHRAYLIPILNASRVIAILFVAADSFVDLNALELITVVASAVLERHSQAPVHVQIAPPPLAATGQITDRQSEPQTESRAETVERAEAAAEAEKKDAPVPPALQSPREALPPAPEPLAGDQLAQVESAAVAEELEEPLPHVEPVAAGTLEQAIVLTKTGTEEHADYIGPSSAEPPFSAQAIVEETASGAVHDVAEGFHQDLGERSVAVEPSPSPHAESTSEAVPAHTELNVEEVSPAHVSTVAAAAALYGESVAAAPPYGIAGAAFEHEEPPPPPPVEPAAEEPPAHLESIAQEPPRFVESRVQETETPTAAAVAEEPRSSVAGPSVAGAQSDAGRPPQPLEAPPVERTLPAWSTLSDTERAIHFRAHRYARVKVAQMQLYRPEACQLGLEQKNLYGFLKQEIDSARELLREQFKSSVPVDYLHVELLHTLADGDESLLGADYPGPLV